MARRVDLSRSNEFLAGEAELLCAITDRRFLVARPQKGVLSLFRKGRPGQILATSALLESSLVFLDFEGRRRERYRLMHVRCSALRELIRYINMTEAARFETQGEVDLAVRAIPDGVEYGAQLAIRNASTWGSDLQG